MTRQNGQNGQVPDTPTAGAHARLQDGLRLWQRAAESYSDPEEFRTYVNACIQALRNVTFVLQKQKDAIPDFGKWYDPWRKRLAADPVMAWLVDARNRIVKEGDLKTRSTARVAIVASYFEPPFVEMDVDPTTSVGEIVSRLDVSHVPKELLEEGFARIERKWIAAGLPAFELLNALAHAYGVLSVMLVDANDHIAGSSTASAVGPQKAEEQDYDAVLPPSMKSAPEFRTVCVSLSNGDIVEVRRRTVRPQICPESVMVRYGPWPTKLPEAFGADDLCVTCEFLFDRAKQVFLADGHHISIAFLLTEEHGMTVMHLKLAGKIDKYLVWRAVAAEVERTNSEAVVAISEAWRAPYDPTHPYRRPGQSPDKEEVLALDALSRTGEAVSFRCQILRTTGGVALGNTVEEGDTSPVFLNPIKDIWAKKNKVTGGEYPLMDRVADLIQSLRVRNIPLESVPRQTLDCLEIMASQKHHLDGAALPAAPPVLLFRITDPADAKIVRQLCHPMQSASPVALVLWPWEARFGALLTITVMGKIPGARWPIPGPMPFTGPYPRVCLCPDDPAFDGLRAGSFIGVFAHDQKAVGAVEVISQSEGPELSPLDTVLEMLSSHRALLHDPIAAYWEVLEGLTIYEGDLTPADHLSFGWVREYLRWAGAFAYYLEAVSRELDGVDLEAAGLSVDTVGLLAALRNGGFRAEPLLQIFSRLDAGSSSKLFRACERTANELRRWAASSGAAEVADLPFFAMDLYLLSSGRSQAGQVLPWLSPDGRLLSLKLVPEQFPRDWPPEEYWKRIGAGLRLGQGICVSGEDVPAALLNDDDWRAFGPAEDVNEAEAESNQLLAELARFGGSPVLDGAELDIDLGEFERMKVTEINGNLYCVLRNTANEFVIAYAKPRNGYCEIVAPPVTITDSLGDGARASVRLAVTKALFGLAG